MSLLYKTYARPKIFLKTAPRTSAGSVFEGPRDSANRLQTGCQPQLREKGNPCIPYVLKQLNPKSERSLGLRVQRLGNGRENGNCYSGEANKKEHAK